MTPGFVGQHPQQVQPQQQWPGRQLPFSQPPPLRGDWSNRALQQQQQQQRQQHQHQLGHLNGGHNGHGHRHDDDNDDAGGGAGLVRAMGAPKFVAPIPRPFNAPAAPSREEEGKQMECPLCTDPMDDTDLEHRPCANCDYNFCLFCFSRLKAGPAEHFKCPACRHPFGDASGSNVNDSGTDSDGDSDASESEIGGAFARAAAAAGRG